MKKLYNRVCAPEVVRQIFCAGDAVFVYGKPKWKKEKEKEISRGDICLQDIKPSNQISIEYETGLTESERMICDSFWAVDNSGHEAKYDSIDVEEMREYIQSINLNYKKILVDITLLNTRFLGAFLAILPEFDWDSVCFCYTEPGEYLKREGESDRFDLKNTTLGFDEIPNLQTEGDITTECEWVVFMGFEGERLQKLDEEASPGRKYVIPVMCIPAMNAEWHNYAMDANLNFIDKLEEHEGFKYVSAVNPFDVYNFLVNEKEQGVRMKISPIGTKLTILGSIMYIIENSEDMLLTDNPFQGNENTKEYGKSYYYDLTYFIKRATNRRFSKEA